MAAPAIASTVFPSPSPRHTFPRSDENPSTRPRNASAEEGEIFFVLLDPRNYLPSPTSSNQARMNDDVVKLEEEESVERSGRRTPVRRSSWASFSSIEKLSFFPKQRELGLLSFQRKPQDPRPPHWRRSLFLLLAAVAVVFGTDDSAVFVITQAIAALLSVGAAGLFIGFASARWLARVGLKCICAHPL
ncbi:hypothetical protein HPP92_022943 [Vanilla planifolia]|uniref:Uncharacterized protein n=1 Tax=Vanilla planifolia TaxID=51239 RepID=A0A835PSW9_VANPL|nr:hypothetical protein HPP92_022943 [Vanilla planifolia]